MSIALDLSQDHQLPNFLSSLKPPPLLPAYSCQRCKKTNCTLHLHGEPWADYQIPLEIDQALQEFFERILREYVYSWYREVSYDEDFVQEIRHCLRYATAVLLKRFHANVNLSQLIIQKAIPIGVNHLDALIHAEEFRQHLTQSSLSNTAGNPEFKSEAGGNEGGGNWRGKPAATLKDAFMNYMGPNLHPASSNRAREVEYVRTAAAKILPHLLPVRFHSPRSMFSLVTDILSGAVLQPLMDLLPNPDTTVNLLVDLAFSPEPSKTFDEEETTREGEEEESTATPSSQTASSDHSQQQRKDMVEYLESFVSANHSPSQSALQMDLSAILKDQFSLHAFMQFLKEESALSQLQFCLSVEDFNKRIMKELTEEELVGLHQEAMDLYVMHFRTNAKHKVNVTPEITKEIFTILSGPPTNVVQLRTTTPLFRAYEEVYNNLESKMCPSFHKSEEYYAYLLGHSNRERENNENTGKNQVAKEDRDLSKTDKFGRGLTKIKQNVFAAKSMEGIIDNLDPAFDLADVYDDGNECDETLTPGATSGGGEYRNLSEWRVSIPRLTTSKVGERSPCFVFVLDINRLDIQSQEESGEDLHWCVERRYSEFC